MVLELPVIVRAPDGAEYEVEKIKEASKDGGAGETSSE
jgi:hypothetical protein